MRPEDLHAWVSAQQAAEEAAAGVDATPVAPRVAWAQAISLMALMGRFVGWPVEPDDIRRHEDEVAAQSWARLRGAGRVPR